MFIKNKNSIFPVIILGLVISIMALIIGDFINPAATQNYRKLYRTALSIEENAEMESASLREMSSINMIKNRNAFQNNESSVNRYLLELNTRFSIPVGSLIFTLFAIALSMILKKYFKISVCITLVSCVIYWAILMYGQRFSIRSGNFEILAAWLPNIVFLCISMILYLPIRGKTAT